VYNLSKEINKTKKGSRRRGNKEGTIYQRKNGDWCGHVTICRSDTGKPLRKTLYGKTRQEVASKVALLSSEVFATDYTNISESAIREFGVLFENWLITFKAPTIKSQTLERYRNFAKNHFIPAFGEMNIKDINLIRFQRFFNEKTHGGYAVQTIKHMKQALGQFYKYAVKQKLVNCNPIEDVKIRDNGRHAEQMALTLQQREIIFRALEQDILLKPILLIFTFTGLRPQELIALRWKNISLEAHTISVTAASNREITYDDNGKVIGRREIIGTTKIAGSIRKFPVSDIVIECLREWYEYQEEQEQKTGIQFTESERFVFSSQKGTMRTYPGLRSLLRRFLKRIGLDNEGISLYTFRHTFATMLPERRENPKIVSTLMGHSKVLTTLSIYSHIISDAVYEDTTKTLDTIYTETMQK